MTKKNRSFTLKFLAIILFFSASWVHAAPGTIILYVKAVATGAGNCTSWIDACTLQTALTTVVPGSEIWVASGTHTPEPTIFDSFQLVNGVGVYGGFAGAETSRDERDPVTNTTILSGDIDGDDSQNPITHLATVTGNNNNCFHVVTGGGTDATAVLDGFVITAGYADGFLLDSGGGGMLNMSGGPTLSNLTVTGNQAFFGGGILNDAGSPSLRNVTLSGNAAWEDGGGMFNYGYDLGPSSPSLVNVTFTDNSAENDGGGMINIGEIDGVSSPSLVEVTFYHNSASDDGGAMYNVGFLTGVCNPSLESVIFHGNTSADSGGAMYNHGDTTGSCKPEMQNVIFSGNSAEDKGGAMANYSNDDGLCAPEMTNITFSENSADFGGAMANYVNDGGSSSPSVDNSILWSNTADVSGLQIYNDSGTPVINHSLVEGGDGGSNSGTSFSDGTGNIDIDPLFVDANGADDITGTTDDDVSLQFGSHAINSGNNATCSPTDILGVIRPQDYRCDMGAYEAPYRFPWLIFVQAIGREANQ